MKKFLLLTALMVTAGTAFASTNFSYQQNATTPAYQSDYYTSESFNLDKTTLKGRVVTVPAGQTFKAVLTAPISSETAATGQAVSMALNSDFYYNVNRIAPAGSSVNGTVIEVSKAKHGTMNGKITLRFTSIVTPTGLNIPISAIVKTDDNTGSLIGGTKLDVTTGYAKDIAIGAGAGAVVGTIAAPLSGGNIGRGAALMTAVGAGGGLVKSLWDKGEDVSIPASSLLELILTQPITVNPSGSEN